MVVLGYFYGDNEEWGVFCFMDGGNIWEKVLYVSDKVGVVDFIIDWMNFKVLYVIIW